MTDFNYVSNRTANNPIPEVLKSSLNSKTEQKNVYKGTKFGRYKLTTADAL